MYFLICPSSSLHLKYCRDKDKPGKDDMSLMLGQHFKPVLAALTAQAPRLQLRQLSSSGWVSSITFTPPAPAPSHFSPGSLSSSPLLAPPSSPVLLQTAGIKHKAFVNKRCRHCYFQVKDEQLYVMCTANPKHYNAVRQKNKKWGNYVFTHATQGSTDGGYGRGSRHMRTQQSARLDY